MRAERERQAELEALDRDVRTVFAYNLSLKADEKDIFQFFIRAGASREALEAAGCACKGICWVGRGWLARQRRVGWWQPAPPSPMPAPLPTCPGPPPPPPGPLNDIKIITDKTTGRSKAFAYVEFQRKEDVINALALTGQVCWVEMVVSMLRWGGL